MRNVALNHLEDPTANVKATHGTALRMLWRSVLYWRFLLFQRTQLGRMVLENICGQHILVLPQVFNPRLFRTGEFLVQTLDARLIPSGSAVLDMGTGSGIGAIFAARWARRVVAVDINPVAVRCARVNALLNQVDDRVEVRLGDLFAPIGDERFDVILFNPPFFRGVPRGLLDRSLHATDVAERFAAGLRGYLNPKGYSLVLLSSDGDTPGFLGAIRGVDLSVEVVAERDLVNEVLTLYRVAGRGFGEVQKWV